MAPRVADLQAQIATLTQELELSTFLNKGILTTNSEHKVRIVELETENAALRAAERRLTATEDALEDAEKRCRSYEREKIAWEREVAQQRQGRVRVEKELEDLRTRLEDIEGFWRDVQVGMDSRFGSKRGESSRADDCGTRREKTAGEGREGKRMTGWTAPARSASASARPRVGKDGRTPRPGHHDEGYEAEDRRSASAEVRASAPGTHRKRRRVGTSPLDQANDNDDDNDNDNDRLESRSASPLPARPPPSRSHKTVPKPAGDPKKKDVRKPSSKRPSSTSNHARKISDDTPIKIKPEPRSPSPTRVDHDDEEDSEADPLAMD